MHRPEGSCRPIADNVHAAAKIVKRASKRGTFRPMMSPRFQRYAPTLACVLCLGRCIIDIKLTNRCIVTPLTVDDGDARLIRREGSQKFRR